VLLRDLEDERGEVGEVGVGERELAERIAGARVEAGGNHHQIRLEALGCRHEAGAKRGRGSRCARSRPGTAG
jgi:hypothetical protein